jgi:hypothetical protein
MSDEFAFAYDPQPDGVIALKEAPLIEMPYFAEPSGQFPSPPFLVNWDDPIFRREIARCLAPVHSHDLLQLPVDKITVCAHVRRGGTHDSASVIDALPVKFPPDSFFIEQIRRISRLFNGKSLYVFLMTDDLNPQAIVERYQKEVHLSNIQWDYRKSPSEHILDDFFSIPQFDCLIRGDSNFSIVASKLGQFAIEIAATHSHLSKKSGQVVIHGMQVKCNPEKISLCKKKIGS